VNIYDYDKLTGEKPKSLLETMNAVAGGDFEFELPTLTGAPNRQSSAERHVSA
jgi:hypothetical protein